MWVGIDFRDLSVATNFLTDATFRQTAVDLLLSSQLFDYLNLDCSMGVCDACRVLIVFRVSCTSGYKYSSPFFTIALFPQPSYSHFLKIPAITPTNLSAVFSLRLWLEVGLFDFITAYDSFKVKVGERILVEGELPLIQETANRVIQPSEQKFPLVRRTIEDKLKDARASKGAGKKIAFGDTEPTPKKDKTGPSVAPSAAPPKKGKSVATKGKTPKSLKKIPTLKIP
ncbi:hypothetical protein Tco_0214331 [Tanacetum coccineum]